ncbi:MAG: hypothetical protein EBX52_11045 [Proteobacteria bacterium]|nr:hypothetical protein [Pseudomonadota bacterium]
MSPFWKLGLKRLLMCGFAPLLWSGCSSVLYHPSRQHFDDSATPLPGREDFSLEAPGKGGGRIHLRYFKHSSPGPAKALLLHFHGNAENLTSHQATLQFVLEQGYDFAIFDYRGFGESVFADPEHRPDPRSTVEDGMLFLDWGRSRAEALNIPWVVFGQSLGGAVALRSVIEVRSRFHPDLVVVDSTFASYHRAGASVLARSVIFWPFQWVAHLVLSDEWAPGSRIGEISPVPLWVLHGNRDETVDESLGREVYHLAKEPKEFWHIEGGRHTDAFWAHEGQWRRKFILELNRRFAPRSEARFREYGWGPSRRDETPIPDETIVYRLPFPPGRAFEVLQGEDGGFSHQGANRLAIDFSEPEGTPVCAVRDGQVFDLKDDSDEGGPDSSYLLKANYIRIRHEDGTIAEYFHLKKNGVQVALGQQVRAGDKIGYSGSTGFASEPHLHLAVYYLDRQGERVGVPMVFDTEGEPAVRLEQGSQYQVPSKQKGHSE